MVWAEIVLIVIGVIMIGASFYITEKLSEQDLDQISMMSEADLKRISEKQVKAMKDKVENALEDIIDESLIVTQRGLEKETNSKIMAVSEYSETVLENINKSHNEITFLYSMLNDKQAETAQLVGDLQKLTKQIRDLDLESTITRLESAANHAIQVEKSIEPISAPVVEIIVVVLVLVVIAVEAADSLAVEAVVAEAAEAEVAVGNKKRSLTKVKDLIFFVHLLSFQV